MSNTDPTGSKNVAQDGAPRIVITRSDRRRKSVAARLVEGGTVLEILAPVAISDAELAPIIDKLKGRVLRAHERKETADDDALRTRAAELNRQYFDGKLNLAAIRYVTNQQHRYGSCTPSTRTIRISHRVATMPTWVRDYVIVHELAHLAEANHGPRFWKLVSRYPRTERARGYLMAVGLESDADDAGQNDIE